MRQRSRTHIKASASQNKKIKRETPAAAVTPGSAHDSVAFNDVYDKLLQTFPEAKTVAANAACKPPHICKNVFSDGRVKSQAARFLLFPPLFPAVFFALPCGLFGLFPDGLLFDKQPRA